jgi:hypothetical protein
MRARSRWSPASTVCPLWWPRRSPPRSLQGPSGQSGGGARLLSHLLEREERANNER